MVDADLVAATEPLPISLSLLCRQMRMAVLIAVVDVGAAVDQRTKKLKPADITEPKFFDELKNSKFLKDLYTEKVSL